MYLSEKNVSKEKVMDKANDINKYCIEKSKNFWDFDLSIGFQYGKCYLYSGGDTMIIGTRSEVMEVLRTIERLLFKIK